MELEEWLQTKNIKQIVMESATLEEFNNRLPNHLFTTYVRLERAFWTVKNFPLTSHWRALHYPMLSKASEFFKEIWMKTDNAPLKEKHRDFNPFTERGIFVYQDWDSKQKNDLFLEDERSKKFGGHKTTMRCELMDGIEPDVFQSVGGIQLIGGSLGWILIANSSTHIGSDWLGIIKNWDIKFNEEFKYDRKITG